MHPRKAAAIWLAAVAIPVLIPTVVLAQGTEPVSLEVELAHALVPAFTLVLVTVAGRLWARYKGSVPDVMLPILAAAIGPVADYVLAQANVLTASQPVFAVFLGAFATWMHQIGRKGRQTMDGRKATPRKAYE